MNTVSTKAFTFLFLTLVANNAFSQQQILKPEESYYAWYNLEEWIYANSNIAYRSADLTNFESYLFGYTSTLDNGPVIYINGQRYFSEWLDKSLLTFPNLSLSDIDSVIIDYSAINQYHDFSPLGTIEIFKKEKENTIYIEEGRINPINDPGIHSKTELKTVNVEAINYPSKAGLNFSYKDFSSSLIYVHDEYSRTSSLVYDRKFNANMLRRTRDPNNSGDVSVKRVVKTLYGANFSLKTKKTNTKASFYMNNIPELYEWHKLSGIEVPAKLKQYQAYIDLELKEAIFFKGSSLGVSFTSSDSLDFSPLALYGVSEKRIAHSSNFAFIIASIPISTAIKTNFYLIEDQKASERYHFNEFSFSLFGKLSDQVSFRTNLGNINQSVSLETSLTKNISLLLNNSRTSIDKNRYNYTFWQRNIGFSNLNPQQHTVNNKSGFAQLFSEARLIFNQGENLTSFIYMKHLWKSVFEEVQYQRIDDSLKLNTSLSYFDISQIGIIGFLVSYKHRFSKKFVSESTVGGNYNLYGNQGFKDHYKSVPTVILSETIQYMPDKNVAFELFFRYVPERQFTEYQILSANSTWPATSARPIKLLNASANMWFFNRILELNVSLRNLLNSDESYDTNGQVYFMSIFVSGKFRFKF